MITLAQSIGAVEAFAIILSVVSLIISVVAFFASLKFYRDGVQLQQAANDALTKLSEKTEFIQTQVGGMFDKTLDAAIGKRELLTSNFDELNEQLEQTKAKLIEESIGQIGAAGEQERKRLTRIVDSQIALVREKIETTRESAEEMVQPDAHILSPPAAQILATIAANPNGLTIRELRDQTGSRTGIVTLRTLSRWLVELEHLGFIGRKDDKLFTWSRLAQSNESEKK